MGTNPDLIRFDSTPPPFLADSIRLELKFQDMIAQKSKKAHNLFFF